MNNQHIYLRGVSTLDSGHTPIIVLDGIIIDAQTYRNMDPNAITAIEVLDNKAAVALYGSRASSGVIILSSKQKTTLNQLLAMPLPDTPMASMPGGVLAGNSIRKNFRDYAFGSPG
ncbi:MAG: TonB-dependent receptor plug domain-containing protein [Cyclobacteriaceae bacterium]|nr:MAG: TonB-dependent receptor plug domain-containing protein [Cyclobacteriaceae bacterium]